jgi:hypothetical protein
MRLAVALLIGLLAAGARAADEDDQILETKPLGSAIPERLRDLEREWEDDVGSREPREEDLEAPPSNEIDGEPAEPPDAPSEARPAPKPRVIEQPADAKPVPAKPQPSGARAHQGSAPPKDGKAPPSKTPTSEDEE